MCRPRRSSEFACKNTYGSSYAAGASNMFLPQNSVGSCDWTITWLQTDQTVLNPVCPWIPVIDGITYKVGT